MAYLKMEDNIIIWTNQWVLMPFKIWDPIPKYSNYSVQQII